MARLILIHGGAHGAWCWQRTLEPLRVAGHRIEPIDLPGRGADANRAGTVTLDDWVRHLSSVIDAGPTPVVLVAHSMGGLAGSQLAERRPGDVSRIVHVAAVVPRDGEAGLPRLRQTAPKSLVFAPGALRFSEDNLLVSIARERLRATFYGSSAADDVDWAAERVCPEPVGPLMTPLALTPGGFGQVPKTYLITTSDRAVPPDAQRVMAADAGAHTIEITSDHSPFISAVDALVDAIGAAVRA
jgi:pimeloyl-ACP methyl ester carboxylesterase